MGKIVQDAGKKALETFAPLFAHFNDDVLFGENWNDETLDLKTRCIITITTLISTGITDNSLLYHLENAKKAGVTKQEIASIITHIAFYAGWPKAWAAFNKAKEIWQDENQKDPILNMPFPLGQSNDSFAKYFIGQSYLYQLSNEQVGVFNVTFTPGCRNNWHIHKGGGQILLCTYGSGYYQEWGKDAVKLECGDVVNIKEGVKHWHGATKDSYFSHIAIEVPGENNTTQWLEEVNDEYYSKLQ